jgi:hypothetical protein
VAGAAVATLGLWVGWRLAHPKVPVLGALELPAPATPSETTPPAMAEARTGSGSPN